MSHPSSSVVVVSHRPGAWLAPCLASVLPHADEVILVDNGSAGGQAGAIGEAQGVRVVRLATNTGFVGGVNAALATVATDVVGLLNDDAVAEPRWLEVAVEALGDPGVAAVGPKIVFTGTWAEIDLGECPHWTPGDARPLGTHITALSVDGADLLARAVGGLHRLETDGQGRRWRWSNGLDPLHVPVPDGAEAGDIEVRVNDRVVAVRRVGDVINNAGSYLSERGFGGDYGFETADDGRFDAPGERFALSGAAMVTRRSTVEALGPLAADFFAYYEDLDWSWRARLAGMTIRYEPAAKVRHQRSATSGGARTTPMLDLLGARNRLLCLVRNAPLDLAGRELVTSLRHPSAPGLRRSVAGHLPRALAARAIRARSFRRRPADVFATWAGRDNTWGLASQAPGATVPGPNDGTR